MNFSILIVLLVFSNLCSFNPVGGDNDLSRNYNKIESDNNKLNESVVEGESKQKPENLPLDFDNGHHQQHNELPDSVKPVDENPNETQIKDDNKNLNVSIMLEKLKQEERRNDHENHEHHHNDRKHSTMAPTIVPPTEQTTKTDPSVVGYNYVETRYSCFSNKKKGSEIAKIAFKENFPITRTKDLRCTQEQCSAINYTYTAYFDNWSGSDHEMTVEYLKKNRRKIFYNGEITQVQYGKVLSGPCEGASISEVNHSPNDDPKGCSGTGVGRVDTDYSTIFIKGCGNEDISCVGGGFQTFSPGLKTNPKTIYSRK